MVRQDSISTVKRWASAFVLVLCGAAMCGAGNGPGIGLKVGAQTLTSPLTEARVTKARFELEICSARLLDDRVDLALAFGFSPLGTLSSESSGVEDGFFVDTSSKDDVSLYDLRVAARYYPLGADRRRLSPYVGAGFGYFLCADAWRDIVTVTDPESSAAATETDQGTTTVAQGLFPFVTAGLNVPLSNRAEVLLEFGYDFEKKDSGFDLGGPFALIGCRFRW